MSDIEFVPLTEIHLTLLYQWFQIPHVKKWYARDVNYTPEMIEEKYLPRIKDNKKIPNYIVTLDAHPIGYIQIYNLEYSLPDGVDSYDHPLFKKCPPNRIAGIDLFIAAEDNLEKGIGSAILAKFIKEKIINNFDLVVADPCKINRQAIKFFTKNGFEELSYINTQSDHLLLAKKCKDVD